MARELEDPFTTELGFWFGANRLYAPHLQTQFDERLLAVGDGSIDGDADFKNGSAGGGEKFGVFLSYALGNEKGAEDDGSLAQSHAPTFHDIDEPVHTGVGRRSAVSTRSPYPRRLCSDLDGRRTLPGVFKRYAMQSRPKTEYNVWRSFAAPFGRRALHENILR